MPQTAEARFLRAAVKAGLRLQQGEQAGREGQTVSNLQRIKTSIQKSRNRRVKQS
jgi:hypothetical protein